MAFKYSDTFVDRLFREIAGLIVDGTGDGAALEAQLCELACANSPYVAEYWKRTRPGLGVPDTAFKGASPYLFPDEAPVRTFRTSGTSGMERGNAHYTARGMELMDLSILTNARRNITRGLREPVILRFVPSEAMAPEMIMAYGMERIAGTLGNRELSACLVGPSGFDLDLLEQRVDLAVRESLPVVMIGGSFAFVNLCDALEARKRSWVLPAGSRVVDAGGFKGRSRSVGVEGMRDALRRVFGIPAESCINLFGMTELASQLYDSADIPMGPLGERPKGRTAFVRPQVRDAQTLDLRESGSGLLEVADLCILDRPYCVFTGDRGIAAPEGVAIAGRIERGQSRGCSLTLDEITGGRESHD
jgi:hypothetical protein